MYTLFSFQLKDEDQQKIACDLYDRLKKNRVDALLDDRLEKPGVKFHDADLIGIPIQMIIGRHIHEGLVEIKKRGEDTIKIPISNVIGTIKKLTI